jgi:hypothetical protein
MISFGIKGFGNFGYIGSAVKACFAFTGDFFTAVEAVE